MNLPHMTIIRPIAQFSTDDLFAEAERIGCVELKTNWLGSHRRREKHMAEIAFDRSTGSRIYARGFGDSPREALANAIKEAESLR